MGSEQSHDSHSNRQRGMPAYSRHTGKNMGSHTHYRGDKIGHPSSNLIGRTRMTRVSKNIDSTDELLSDTLKSKIYMMKLNHVVPTCLLFITFSIALVKFLHRINAT